MPDAQPVTPEDVRLPSPSPSEPHLLEPAQDVRLPSPTPSEDLLQDEPTRSDSSWSALPTRDDLQPAHAPSFIRSRSPSPEPVLPNPAQRRQRRPPITARIRTALGLNTPSASLTWRLGFGTTEIVIIAVLLGLASAPGSVPVNVGVSTGQLGMSQWEACGRPLGPWNIVWAVKAGIGLGMAGWEYWRSVRPSTDQLLAVERARLSREVRRTRRETARVRRSRQGREENTEEVTAPPRAVVRSPRRLPTRDVWTMGGGREDDLDLIDATMSGNSRSLQIVERMRKMRARREREERWYARCTSLIALYGLVWFVTANILLYGSMDTCRYSSPYIWWLTFGILCLGYIVVAEMLLVALVVFVIGPLLLLSINIVLVCLGRHPIQPTGRMGHINPDVPKMPRGMVDRIPLVTYIPMPGDQPTTTEPEPTKTPDHSYPPKPKRRRFFFFRKNSKANSKSESGVTKTGDGDLEAGYEKTEYPFVKLESNRAACAICLMDFEPPKKVGEEGAGGEPLRLLACGHVFHKECLDPWLVDVSGRCPTCQRPVEEEDLDPETGGKKEKRRWRRRS